MKTAFNEFKPISISNSSMENPRGYINLMKTKKKKNSLRDICLNINWTRWISEYQGIHIIFPWISSGSTTCCLQYNSNSIKWSQLPRHLREQDSWCGVFDYLPFKSNVILYQSWIFIYSFIFYKYYCQLEGKK